MSDIIIIGGATASGKSSVAVEIAKMLNTEVIGADSMQIFKRMNIGTAKITPDETDGIVHNMIDIVEPNCEYSVAQYVKDCENEIERLIELGKIPIICGGTGLYIDGIIFDFGFGIKKDEELRKRLSDEYDADGGAAMYDNLMKLDPADTSKYHKNNKQRVIRAMEIYLIAGKVKSELGNEKQIKRNVDLYVIDVDRSTLYINIEKRVDKMIESGLINEIDGLLNDGVTFDMQSMQGIGYKEFKNYYANLENLEQAIDKVKQNSRNYAKRQITWFKKYDFAKFTTSESVVESIYKKYKDTIAK